MAESKKSFIAYSDWKETFDSLPDEYAGKLIKHIFAYVNDENPTTEDFVINSVFANIKNTLKRDLDKWEKQIEQRSEAGKKSAEARRKKQEEDNLLKNKELQEQRNSTSVETRATNINEEQRNSTDNVSVSVSVSDNVILLEKETKDVKFNFKKSLIDYGFKEDLVNDWLLVRKGKKLTNTKTAFNKFIKQVELNGSDKNLILEECVSRSWGGFESSWIDKQNTQQQVQAPLIQKGKTFEEMAMEDYEKFNKHRFE